MCVFWSDPDDPPRPRSEVRIREVTAVPYPDGRRVRLAIQLTPFEERPNLEIEVLSASGEQVATMTLVESLQHELELTVHLRESRPEGEYRALVAVHYTGEPPVDTRDTSFAIRPPSFRSSSNS